MSFWAVTSSGRTARSLQRIEVDRDRLKRDRYSARLLKRVRESTATRRFRLKPRMPRHAGYVVFPAKVYIRQA